MINFQNIFDSYNQRPIADFEGLSPIQMQSLLYDLFGANSVIKINNDISNENIDQVSFFRICEEFISIINREVELKLTPNGNLPKKIVKEIYDKKFITDSLFESGILKNFVEREFIFIHNAKIICKQLNLIKKQNNKLSLTAKGKKIIASNKRIEFFNMVLLYFIKEFNWSYNDGYNEEHNGQFGSGFTLFLLLKYGLESRSVQFYADKYLKAFPKILDNFPEDTVFTKQRQFNNSFSLRTFNRFLFWFNCIEITEKKSYNPSKEMSIKSSKLLTPIFQLKF
jgi:hypothetical protein